MLGSKISNALQITVLQLLYAFEIEEGTKEDYTEVGEARQALGGRIVVKETTCSLQVVTSNLLQRCVNLDAQKQWIGLA